MKTRTLILIILLLICTAFIWRHAARKHVRFPRAIVVHESASRWGDADTIRLWHHNRGWREIGYHAVILNGRRSKNSGYNPNLDGKIEPGQSEHYYGTHCQGDNMNAVALGVCLVGEPDHGGYPTRKQIDALVHYCTAKCRQYDIPASAITQHSDHDYRKPLCASLDMNYIRRRVQEALARD